MHKVLIAGAGKIGSLIACLLLESKSYTVHMVDQQFEGGDVSRLRQQYPQLQTHIANVQDPDSMRKLLGALQIEAIISSLPYFCNIAVAQLAREFNLHYFDLTEDVTVTQTVSKLAEGARNAFVPQCGLAPGFINIAAHTLMSHFDTLDTVKLRVGALPQYSSNALHYALTWSTDGVINEYGNPCNVIENGKEILAAPLEGLESISIDGCSYEAFHTSGGLGSLAKTYAGKVRNLDYKTIRYPGHCEKMRLLMNELRLNEDRETLKRILERAIPKTYQDVIIIYVSVTGMHKNQLMEEYYVKKVYPHEIGGLQWSAIQVTTAAGITTVVDAVFNQPARYQGLVLQEQFTLDDVLNSRFGQYYR